MLPSSFWSISIMQSWKSECKPRLATSLDTSSPSSVWLPSSSNRSNMLRIFHHLSNSGYLIFPVPASSISSIVTSSPRSSASLATSSLSRYPLPSVSTRLNMARMAHTSVLNALAFAQSFRFTNLHSSSNRVGSGGRASSCCSTALEKATTICATTKLTRKNDMLTRANAKNT